MSVDPSNVRWFLLTVWLSMLIIWSFSDRRSFADRIKTYLSLRPLLYTATLLIALSISIFLVDQFRWNITGDRSPITFIGLAVFIVGFGLAVWAKYTMNRSWGVPGQHDIKEQKELIVDGPFRFSRNPIYLGLILMFFGYFVALQSSLIIFAILGASYFYKMAIIEEKLLGKYFGKDYLKYKTKTPLFI